MLIRVRTSEKTFRFEIHENIQELYFHLQHHRPSTKQEFILKTAFQNGEIITEMNQLEHGQLVFLEEDLNLKETHKKPKLPFDVKLEKEEGIIYIQSKNCLHKKQEMCLKCLPLPSYDKKYHDMKQIKHLSFYAYLQKKKSLDFQYTHPLSEPSFAMKQKCQRHQPYPIGICTECRPSTINLTFQEYRLVDHIEFESFEIVDSFLQKWRETGNQQFGFLYGKYQRYNNVPLGTCAVVSAIYIPPQKGSREGLELEEDPSEEAVQETGAVFGLEVVGMIFTDLTGLLDGTAEYKRRLDTYFVSSTETVFIAKYQIKNRFHTEFSSTGTFGSRFVTIIVSGDENGSISLSSYQISNTGMKMIEEGIIGPTTDPHLLYVQSKPHPVPTVLYIEKEIFGNTIQREASPTFPVDYLLVSLTHGFSHNNKKCFQSHHGFPPLHQLQHPTSHFHLNTYLQQNNQHHPLFTLFFSFNIACYLYTSPFLSPEEKMMFISSIKEEDSRGLEQFLSQPGYLSMIEAGFSSESWSCQHCTYENSIKNTDCEMCCLPRN